MPIYRSAAGIKQKIDLLFIQSQQAQKERAQPEQYREVCAADGENVADAETSEIAFQAVCKSVLVADQQRLQHGSGLGLVCAVDPRGDCALQPREKRRLLLADDRVCRDGAGEQDAVRDLAVPPVVAVEVGRKRRTVGDGSDHVARFEVDFALKVQFGGKALIPIAELRYIGCANREIVGGINGFCDGCSEAYGFGLRFQRRERPVKEHMRQEKRSDAEGQAEKEREKAAPQLRKAEHAGKSGKNADTENEHAEPSQLCVHRDAAETCGKKNSAGGKQRSF